MKDKMKNLVAALVLLLYLFMSGALAGDIELGSAGRHFVLLDIADPDPLLMVCGDVYEWAEPEKRFDVYVDLYGRFSGLLLSEVVLLCTVGPVDGDGYFFPTSDILYVVDGISYTLGYTDYSEYKGSVGRMRGSAGIFLRLRGARAGDRVTLYLQNDSVTFDAFEGR